jgi:hypothetical protein
MRTTVIPAQITTVEDKIAGSLSMTQILILITPVLWATLLYVVLIPQMKLSAYKLTLILITSVICIVLALRIKGKVVLEWISILLKYQIRPKYYLFNKNSLCQRQIDIPKNITSENVTQKNKQLLQTIEPAKLSINDLIKLDTLINSGKLVINLNFKNKHP